MTVQWINEEVGVGAPPGGVQWLGDFGLGQPPQTCPGGGGTPSTYTACRLKARNDAIAQCPAGAFQTPGGGTDEVALQQCIQANYFANFNAANCFQHCPAAQQPCTSDVIIRFGQEQLGRPQTGVWTVGDQAALDATGETFQQLVGSCSGSAPVPIGGGPGPQPEPPPPPPPPTAKKGGGGLGLVLLAGAAAVAIALAQS